MRLGIDFGTTNSAVAILDGRGDPRMVELAPGEAIQRTVIHCDPRGNLSFGNAAFKRYVEQDLEGRLLRSLKSFLSQDVPPTYLAGRKTEFTDLVTLYLRWLVRETEEVTGQTVEHVVMGRPVHFNVDESLDDLAIGRLSDAVRAAGIEDFSFELEPIAAARAHEHRIDQDRIVLVGDFGGGTADFAVLRVGPSHAGSVDRSSDVLGTAGVARAGDALDARFLDTFLMEYFGRGSVYARRRTGELVPWDHPVQRWIQRLYYIHLLRDENLRRKLEDVQQRMPDKTVVRRLIRLIFDDLGYPLAWAVEKAKKALSREGSAQFEFDEFYSAALDITHPVDLEGFAEGSRSILEAYRGGLDTVLSRSGLEAADIDDVFLTGGTSQLPFVQDVFVERFGADALRSGDSMTSVCEGLALGRRS